MNRLLLALIALLTGLAAQGAPAQAWVCLGHDTEIGAGVSAKAATLAAVLAKPRAVRQFAETARAAPDAALPEAFALPVQTVRIGIDRARQ